MKPPCFPNTTCPDLSGNSITTKSDVWGFHYPTKINFVIMKKQLYHIIPVFIILVFLCACNKPWEDHYEGTDPRIDMSIWDVIKDNPDFSLYAEYAQRCGLDSILKSSNSVTVFIPPVEALQSLADSGIDFLKGTLSYEIVPTLFLTRNVQQYYNLSTLSGKLALIENSNYSYFFDGKAIIYKSPLFKNGIYYKLEDIVYPKLNIYEYLQKYNPFFASYIDSQDSIFLSDSLSKPIGFNSEGQTIYKDSVILSINRFERDYFPVSEEFRDKVATLVVPSGDQYNEVIAKVGNYLGLAEIPALWQEKVLIPYLINQGLFDGRLDSTEFLKKKLRNIMGDSVVIENQPTSLYIASNGYVYNYSSFTLPESFYKGNIRIEGEDLLDSIGSNVYAWKDFVKVTGDKSVKPERNIVPDASKGKILSVLFPQEFSGQYTIEFTLKNIFPREYQFIWSATYRTGAVYAIYVNDEKVREFDLYNLINTVFPQVGTIPFYPDKGFNKFDAHIQNIQEFGDIPIKIDYVAKGNSPDNGLNIDYIELIPLGN